MPRHNLRIDEATLRSEVLPVMPPAIHEEILFLARYTIERCNRSLDDLEAKVKSFGHKWGASTLKKILTGKYFQTVQDGNGKPRIEGSIDNFQSVIESLRKEYNLSQLACDIPFIETPTTRSIWNYIDEKRSPMSVCKFGAIVGPTGTSKTAAFKQYCTENNHGTCVWVESPETPSITQFKRDLGYRYGVPPTAATYYIQRTLERTLDSTKCVIIDNVQRLFVSKRAGDQPLFHFIQKMNDQVGCTFILSFTPEFRDDILQGAAAGYFEQFVGRIGGEHEILELEPYPTREDCEAFARGFQMREPKKAAARLEEIGKHKGRVRVLLKTLQRAKQYANMKSEPLTLEHVEFKLPEAMRKKLKAA